MKKLMLCLLLFSVNHAAEAVIIYDVSFSETTGSGGTGSATVTFGDMAFDADGVFDFSLGVLDYTVQLDGGFAFTFADQTLNADIDYEVVGGELVGFDWQAQANFGSFDNANLDPNVATSTGSDARLFSLFAPCDVGECIYNQTWTRREMQVPEPSTIALLGLGFAGIGAARRRRQA